MSFYGYAQHFFYIPSSLYSVTQSPCVDTRFLCPFRNCQSFAVKLKGVLLGRCCQRLFDAPTSVDAVTKSADGNANLPGPLGHSQVFPLKLKSVIMARVVVLLLTCTPLAIAWLIVTIIIYALYTVLRPWFWPHISVEVFKTISPTFANLNTPITIILIAYLVWIFATRFDSAPSYVFSRIAQTMLCVSLLQHFCVGASTGLCSFFDKTSTQSYKKLFAVTLAKPKSLVPFVPADKSKRNKAAKSLTSQVFCSLICYGNDLRKIFRRLIVGMHQKLPFWCQASGRLQPSRWQLIAHPHYTTVWGPTP